MPFALAVLLAALLGPTVAQAAPGDLDPSFGTGGKVITDFGGDVEGGIAAEAIDSRGRIVAAGYSGRRTEYGCCLTLARYRPDGSLDPSFGTGGLVTTGQGGLDYTSSVAIDARGRILAAGGFDGDFALARYMPDGSPDASFGTGGLVTTDFGGREYLNSIAIDARGRILAAGTFDGDFALARYTPDGSLDPSFSGDGKEITVLRHPRVWPVFNASAAIDSRNRIYVAGSGDTRQGGEDFVIVRYRPNGAISRSYGRHGHLITDFGGADSLASIAIDSHGRVVGAGQADDRVALARYTRDGTLSRSFGGDGKVRTRFGHQHGSNGDAAYDVAIDSRGRIVAVGDRDVEDDPSYAVFAVAVARYRSDGRLDRSFGGDGTVTTRFGTDTLSAASAVAIDARDRIIAAGYRIPRHPRVGGDWALARYIGYRGQ